MALLSIQHLRKTYQMGDTTVHALRDVSVEIESGEFVAVMGPSGSGKSTFMNMLGCLDLPDANSDSRYELAGELVSSLSTDALADVRNQRIGFVFQHFNLLARTSALDNVQLPLRYARQQTAQSAQPSNEARALRALEQVGLAGRAHHTPNQLSGGQQQRVAIARALVNQPALILADEPTGALDSRTSIEVMALLQALNQQGLTIVLVTHEQDIALYAQRVLLFRDGRIVSDTHQTPRSASADLSALNSSTPVGAT